MLAPDRVHGVQLNRIIGFSFGEPINQFNSVSAVGSVLPQIMIAVNFINNGKLFFAFDYLFDCFIDTVTVTVSVRCLSDVIEPYFYMILLINPTESDLI